MEVQGTIKVKKETETFGAKGFRKREFVITTSEQYPQDIQVELVQDKCDLLDQYSVGDAVKVSINLRGREWINPEGVAKYFNSVQGWRIESVQLEEGEELPSLTVADNELEAVDSDLPF